MFSFRKRRTAEVLIQSGGATGTEIRGGELKGSD